jgi:tetratricopeptide (TPR) repeat protein
MGYVEPRVAVPQAKAAILKARDLDDTLPGVHGALAGVHWVYDWDWAAAEVEFKKQMELNGNHPDPGYSHYLMCMKRPGEAIAQIRRVLEADPFNTFAQAFYGVVLVLARRTDEGIVELRKALNVWPDLPFAHSVLSYTYFCKGMYEESLAESKLIYAGDREMLDALTRGYEQSGFRSAMRRAADLLATRSRKAYVGPCETAELYLMAGESDQAMAWLEKGLELRDPNMPYVNADPTYDAFRNTPRFQDIIRRMNLPQ